jgi:hypothetical protein
MSGSGPAPPGAPQIKSLNCPGCGAAITLRCFTQAVTVVCDHCHSILDAQDPRLKILQKFKAAVDEDPPRIPLGTRGTIRGAPYETIGFERRTIQVDGFHKLARVCFVQSRTRVFVISPSTTDTGTTPAFCALYRRSTNAVLHRR